ncbi:MAG: sporulation protein YabP [Bacillota bacterium]|jgi:sporulation protein YabP|nr:sporulation protein YabP [Bacillota bacterium]MDI9415899.1 sporulation protein YabP [Bacillota bacterium]NLD12058.1 sporulation protein YabP [Bacillota bacterium]HCD41221.1 sporulation protein YabP [Bacillota bacterium]HOB89032.1 sporulation protein YabP [Bacillota bacterium]
MLDDRKRISTPFQHKLTISEREAIVVDGVNNVESFDDQEVILETTSGMLILHGRDFHIKQLNLDQGNLQIEGYVMGLEYAEETGKKARGFLERLFK